MGVIDFKTMQGVNWENANAVCRDVFQKKVFDQMFGGNFSLKASTTAGFKAVDPGLAIMLSNQESLVDYGPEQGTIDQIAVANGGAGNPKGRTDYVEKETLTTHKTPWGYSMFPLLLSEADAAKGEGQLVPWVAQKYAEILAAAAQDLARQLRGNGNQYYDNDSGTWKDYVGVSTSYMPMFGFGKANDTVANAVFSTQNTFGGRNRADDKYKLLRARVYDIQSATDAALGGFVKITSINALSAMHFYMLRLLSRVGGNYGTIIEVGTTVWAKAVSIFEGRRTFNENATLAKYGFAQIAIDNNCSIVHNPQFVDPTQIDCWDPAFTRIQFPSEHKPMWAPLELKQELGFKRSLTTLWYKNRLQVDYPALHSRYHNVPLT